MFSKACKYGIRAVLYLAVHASVQNKIGVQEIADSLQIPKHFLAKILQLLSKNELISSTKGPKGGFYLSEADYENTIQKIVECIDGIDVFTSCVLGLPVCSDENPCPLHIHAFSFREGLKYQLKHQSINELAWKINNDNIVI